MSSPQKISQLTTAGPLTGAELVPVVQNGGTLQTTVAEFVAIANVSLIPEVSALATHIDQVSALTSINAAAISTLDGQVSVLNVQMTEVQASISAINSVLAAIDTSALLALETRVSTLEIRVTNVSASVSALQVQLDAVSALTSVNAASITSINAVVSTKVNRIGDFMDNVQYIEFDTSTGFPVSVGRLTWDATHGTLDLGLIGGNANLLLGQREVVYCFNNSAATLSKGDVVRVTGASGQRLTVDLALADSDADSATILGIMLEAVSVNASGFVATDGVVNNVNTMGFTDGQIIYLSPVSAGKFTATKPIAPQHLVQLGYVVKGGSTGAGSLYIKVQNGYELGELHDVKTSTSTSIQDGEILAYNTSAQVWTNSTALINTQASVSVLQIQVDAVSALTSVNAARIAAVSASVSALQVQIDAVSAALTSTNNVVSALEVRVSAVSALASVNAAAITSINNVVSALEIRVSAASATGATNAAAITSINNVVSALEIRVSTVSAQASAIQAQVNNVSALVSALDVRVAAVSASVSVLQIQVDNVSAALTSTNNVVSALEIRVSAVSAQASATQVQVNAVSALVSVLDLRVTNVSASVSVLQVQVDNVSAALTSTNNVVSALEIRVSSASAAIAVNSAAITSINNVVSALEIRVSAVSAVAAANTAAITSINNVVSALEIRVSTVSAQASAVQAQVNAVSVLVSVLDVRLTAVSASVSVLQVQVNNVSAVVSQALVSISQRVLKAGDTMTGELNMSDNLVTRPKFKDYALTAVIKGNVSATTTLDLVEGNYFTVTAAGSTTFVFANPPVSAADGGAAGGFILELANGGAATVTWPTATKWPGGTAPTLTTSGTDVLVFVTDDGGTIWRGVQSMKDSK